MTDTFDPADDDDRALAGLQDIVRETGLEAYMDLDVPDDLTRVSGVIHVINRSVRVLEDVAAMDAKLEAAGDWNEVVFKADPALPEAYVETDKGQAFASDGYRLRSPTNLDRERGPERRDALRAAINSLWMLRRAYRNQD